jgi:phage head maturation protease
MEHPRARAVHGMIKGGLVSGLSIGFRPKASTQQGRNRVISALDLFEIGVARNPSHQLSCSQMRSRRFVARCRDEYPWHPWAGYLVHTWQRFSVAASLVEHPGDG